MTDAAIRESDPIIPYTDVANMPEAIRAPLDACVKSNGIPPRPRLPGRTAGYMSWTGPTTRCMDTALPDSAMCRRTLSCPKKTIIPQASSRLTTGFSP